MQARLRQVLVNPLHILGIICMLCLMLLHEPTSVYYYLTVAQLIYIPIVLQQIVTLALWQRIILAAGQLAVTALYFFDEGGITIVLALIYVASTIVIFGCGVQRFLQRGFTNVAELMIDVGLVYIAMGGIWFFAHIAGIDTGFSPIITWLTAIHFHYSAFLLCITVGLIGRLYRSRLFSLCGAVIALGPMLVAIGITFSRVVEIVSVSLYVMAIFTMTILLFRIKFQKTAAILIHIAFLTLCFTIIWSFLYAYSNVTNSGLVDIPTMLQFHGLLNCLLFGGAITIAWSVYVPKTTQQPYTFPKSQLRGRIEATGTPHHALVDDMNVFIKKETMPAHISDFYEQTMHYELTMRVKWKGWFKPLAFLYQFVSRKIGQLNIPFSSKPARMDSTITRVSEALDGRHFPRLWQRKINGHTVFSAVYSVHTRQGKSYMNIALPLPLSVMHGILTLRIEKQQLHLTSDADGDAGTYLSIGRYTLKLPLHEYFTIWEENEQLYATHNMTLFRLPFLTVSYSIQRKEVEA